MHLNSSVIARNLSNSDPRVHPEQQSTLATGIA
jgi:hypothetical protein